MKKDSLELIVQTESDLWNPLWTITKQLNNSQIPYVISGGTASYLYSGKRQPVDIDIDIPAEFLSTARELFRSNIIEDIHRLIYGAIDVTYFTLNVAGKDIDISAGDTCKVGLTEKKPSMTFQSLFKDAKRIIVNDKELHIIDKNTLVDYKQILGRDVDIEDIENLGSGKSE